MSDTRDNTQPQDAPRTPRQGVADGELSESALESVSGGIDAPRRCWPDDFEPFGPPGGGPPPYPTRETL